MQLTRKEIDNLPTVLYILDKIAQSEETLRNDKRYGLLLSDMGAEDKFEIRPESANGPYILHPTSSTVNTFFRGQTNYHSECLPTIYRKEKNQPRDELDIFIDRLRSMEFELLLKTHPFVKSIYERGLLIQGKEHPVPIKVDYLGLAQHYELKTDLMDFTNDKWVAAFFATCSKVKGKYVPVKSAGYGVIYSYTVLPEFFDQSVQSAQKSTEKFTAIGLQPFPRPGEQKGFALKLEPSQELNTLQGVKQYFFRHNYKASEVIYNRMNQGKSLFPADKLINMAKKLKNSKKISKTALRKAFKRYPVPGSGEQELEQKCRDKGFVFVDSPVVSFSRNDEDLFWNQWNNGAKQKFMSQLVLRRVYY